MKEQISTYKINLISRLWIGIPALILLFSMCQEPYFNENLETEQKIPVFNAVLSNIDILNSFELYYAMPYTDQRIEPISGAIITITSTQNQRIQLEETAPGIYKLTDETFILNVDEAYTASIQLTDGEILKSQPAQFYDTLAISNIFFDFNIQTTVVKNSAGDFINVDEEGIVVQFRLKKPSEQTIYYRANANYYVHSEKWVNKTRDLIINDPHYDIIYEIRYDTLYDIYEGYANTNFPITGELSPSVNYTQSDLTIAPLFLPADVECLNFSKYTTNRFKEWVVPVDLYHHSQNVFKYYSDAAKQLNATGQIFDPIPDQIYGNIYNETDATKPALGLFDVSSVNRKYLSIYVHEALGYRQYKSRILTDTVIKQGWYVREYYVDTVFVDSVPILE